MELMTVQNAEPSEFYLNYVKEIIARVEEKARMEFEFIWNEHLSSKKRCIDITDK